MNLKKVKVAGNDEGKKKRENKSMHKNTTQKRNPPSAPQEYQPTHRAAQGAQQQEQPRAALAEQHTPNTQHNSRLVGIADTVVAVAVAVVAAGTHHTPAVHTRHIHQPSFPAHWHTHTAVSAYG